MSGAEAPRRDESAAPRFPGGTRRSWLLPALALLATCGVTGLIEPTETRYAAIARAMRDSGDWLIPRLNGLPHFHKPPLAYWLSAGGMAALGVNEWGARLAVALAAGFVLWCTARIASLGDHAADADRAGDGARAASAPPAPLLLASTVLFFALSRQLASDVFLAAAVAGFYAAWLGDRSRRSLWPFLALAAGFMAKGPVVFALTVLPVLAAAGWTRHGALARPLASARGWLLFALLALPWYLIAVARTPGLLPYFLGNQIWARYASTEHQRGGPIWYFIPVLIGGSLPWTWAAVRGAAQASRTAGDRDALLVAWIAAPLVFLSFSGSKLPAYLLPVFPAVALLAARGAHGAGRALTAATGLTLVLLAAGVEAALVLVHPDGGPLPRSAAFAGHVIAAAFLVAAALAGRARWAWASSLVFGTLLVGIVSTYPVEGALGSPRPMLRVLVAERRAGEPVVEFARFNAGVPFYLGEPVLLLDVPRERQFSDERSLDRILVARSDLPGLTVRAGRSWILGPEGKTREMLESLGLRAELRARWKREALFLARDSG